MAEHAGNVARFHFESANLAPEVFQVARLDGVEGISKPFRFEISLISEDPDISFGDIVNQRAELSMRRVEGEDRKIHGIVTHIRQANRVAEYVAYSVVLEPRLRLLSLSFQSRIFRDATVEEIVTEVLSDSEITGGDLNWDLKTHYDPREYVVQHQETDLDFISRLLEHEGIHYFFSHTDGHDKIIFSDGNHAHEMVGGATPEFMYNPGASLIPDESHREFISSFAASEYVVTGKFVLNDYNYRTPSTAIDVESNINPDMPGTKYEYGNHYADRSTGKRLAKVRNEEVECRRVKMSGKSNILHLESGYVFSQIRHFADSLNQDYLVHEVVHVASQAQSLGVMGVDEYEDVYTNEFRCVPASAPFRPERITPVPQVAGITTGKIETGGGDYAYIDDDGRYRAKMHFDQSGETDGAATRPIRMSQPYSGPDYGMHFPLHAGTEVVVAHVNGNIDRPVVLGTVPNPNNTSPSTSANKPQSVIRTWGKNELTFDDKKGEENIYMHATKDHTVAIDNDESISIEHDQSQSIGNDQTESIGNDQKLSVGNDRSKEVGNDQAASIGNNKTISVGADHTESIGANMKITISTDLTEEVGKNYSETVGDNMKVDVGASMTITVGKDKTDEVGKKYSESVGSDSSTEIGGAKTEKVGKKSSLD
ncbi:MAG: type VI secretion system Vgr family protein, partial [Rhodothermia bacterium]